MYLPDCSSSDEEGMSDDNDYYEFKERMKKQQREKNRIDLDSEAEQKEKKLRFIKSAISFGKSEVIIEELNKGLDVDVDLESGWTPLLLAASVANQKIISILIERGANVNQSRDELTPLMLVCNISSNETVCQVTECVKVLLDNGAAVNAVDRKRRTAIMLAAYNGHLEAVKLLLPHVDKDAEDNQKWTALFWAVEGHQTGVVELLLKENFSCDKVDIRGNTVADIAHTSGYEDILALLPKDPYDDEVYINLNNNHLNFENTFNNLDKHEKPDLFADICKMLYGTRSESVVPLFQERRMALVDFLASSHSKLKEIGIQLPYQRNRIMGGLFQFHKHPFNPKSLPIVKKNEIYTNIDVASTVLTSIKQLIAMEASLKFMIANNGNKLKAAEAYEMRVLISKNRRQIKRLGMVAQQFVDQAEMWDLTLKPADKITKKRWNIPWCNLCLSVGVVSLAVFVLFRIK